METATKEFDRRLFGRGVIKIIKILKVDSALSLYHKERDTWKFTAESNASPYFHDSKVRKDIASAKDVNEYLPILLDDVPFSKEIQTNLAALKPSKNLFVNALEDVFYLLGYEENPENASKIVYALNDDRVISLGQESDKFRGGYQMFNDLVFLSSVTNKVQTPRSIAALRQVFSVKDIGQVVQAIREGYSYPDNGRIDKLVAEAPNHLNRFDYKSFEKACVKKRRW